MLGKLFRPMIDDARDKFEKFFFAEEAPYAIALTRISLPLVVMGVMLHRWYYVRELYTADGAPAPLADNFGYWNWLPILPGWFGVAAYGVMIFLFLTASIGWYTRFSLAASAILYAYFGLLDQLSTINKYTVIATHVLLLLSVSDCGAVWSLDSWLARRGKRNFWPGDTPVEVPKSAVWPRRLIQILCGVIYFGAAMTKIHTPSFFSGDQLIYWMMTHFNWSHPVGDFLTQYPAMVVTMCYVTIVWEMTFLFCAWKGWARVVYVWTGVFFHAMTALTLGLLVFPLVMYAAYVSFLNEEDIQWYYRQKRWFKRKVLHWRGRVNPFSAGVTWLLNTARAQSWSPVQSAGMFAVAGTLLVAFGLGLEYKLDRYGERRSEGRYALMEIAPEEATRMLGPQPALREKDRLQAFNIGTTLVGGRLLDRRTNYRYGQRIVCEASFNPPHPDMWVECNLYDGEHHLIQRLGDIVARERFHAHFNYALTDALPPGEYYLVLRTKGQDLMERKFVLNGTPPAPVGN